MKEMNGKVNFWAVFMNFGGNATCSSLKTKTSSGSFNEFASYAKIIADPSSPGFFLSYFLGRFEAPVFVVIDAASKEAVSIASNNDYPPGYHPDKAFNDAKAAVTSLLNTGVRDTRKSAALYGGFSISVSKRIIAIDNPSGTKADMTLVNSAGRTVMHAATSGRKAEIPTVGLSSGVYMLKCDGEKQSAAYRVFVQ
jgi:hypothetical protein